MLLRRGTSLFRVRANGVSTQDVIGKPRGGWMLTLHRHLSEDKRTWFAYDPSLNPVPPGKEKRVYFQGVERRAPKEDLVRLASSVGRVSFVKLLKDWRGERMANAVVEYREPSGAKQAIRLLNNHLFYKQQLKVRDYRLDMERHEQSKKCGVQIYGLHFGLTPDDIKHILRITFPVDGVCMVSVIPRHRPDNRPSCVVVWFAHEHQAAQAVKAIHGKEFCRRKLQCALTSEKAPPPDPKADDFYNISLIPENDL